MPRYPIFISLTAVILLAASCASRYRMELFVTEGTYRDQVKVERTEYLRDTRLGDPMSAEKVERGNANCLVLVTGHRGHPLEGHEQDFISFDRYVRHRIFIEFPIEFSPGDYDLTGISFAQLLGRYELSVEDKMYFPTTGTLTIDSLPGGQIFGTLRAAYENRKGEVLDFDGRFKADYRP